MRLNYCIFNVWIIIACILPSVSAKTVEEAFEEANQAYASADMLLNQNDKQKAEQSFNLALELYKTCLEKAESTSLHFNMGNTYYKLGKPGYAIYHYRKALQLDPSSEEVRANLQLANQFADLPLKEESLYEQTLGRQSPHFWKWVLCVSLWLGISLIILPRYFGFVGPVPLIIGFVVISISVLPIIALKKASDVKQLGIILEEDTPILVSPTQTSAIANYLQAGHTVSINHSVKAAAYLYIISSQGDSGWIPTEKVGRLHP